MGKTLILAEKPSVGRDIARVLGVKGKGEGCITGDDYIVSWAVGHLIEICNPEEMNPEWKQWRFETLPMLPKELKTKVISQSRKQYSVVKSLLLSPEIDDVICATDSGREGELIFRYIYRQAGCKKPVRRLWISSMTDAAIKEGFRTLKPDSDYDSLYISARCRSDADWLIGMNASRAFSIRYNAQLPIGRVQTPTLSLLVQRAKEIREFVPKDYWEIKADFGDYAGLWLDRESNECRCYDEQKATAVADKVRGKTGTVTESSSEHKKQPSPQLYDLTSLQREANKLLGLSAAKTLNIVQDLYEKHKLLTYPRTDSRYLPHDMIPKVKKIIETLPQPYTALTEKLKALPKLPVSGRYYNDAKVSDHHAIVPTGNYSALSKLSDIERKVFDMVAKRLISIHYPDYEYDAVKLITTVEGEPFRSSGSTPTVMGWKEVYGFDDDEAKEPPVPLLPVGTERKVHRVTTKALKTKPPVPHTDASLLHAMETAGRILDDEELRESMKDSGLGTPATRAATIEHLIEKGYAKRMRKAIEATEKGEKLISVAPEDLTSPVITGRWEKALSGMAKQNAASDASAMADRFMEGIHKFAAFLVEQGKTAPEMQFEREEYKKKGRKSASSSASKVTDVGIPCPVCKKGHVTENSKAFGCSEWKNGCKFTIWKNCLESSGGPTLTAKLVQLVIEKGSVRGSTGTIDYQPPAQPKFTPK